MQVRLPIAFLCYPAVRLQIDMPCMKHATFKVYHSKSSHAIQSFAHEDLPLLCVRHRSIERHGVMIKRLYLSTSTPNPPTSAQPASPAKYNPRDSPRPSSLYDP